MLLSGRKRVDLYPPSAHRELGAGEAMLKGTLVYNHSARHCALNKLHFDGHALMYDFAPADAAHRRKLLRQGRIRRARCSLDAGDILYLPTGWWHEVDTRADDEGSAAVSYFFDPYWTYSPNSSFFTVSPEYARLEQVISAAQCGTKKEGVARSCAAAVDSSAQLTNDQLLEAMCADSGTSAAKPGDV